MREHKFEWSILYLKCGSCWELLSSDNYHKDNSKEFWFRTTCKKCKAHVTKIYYENNKDKEIERISKRQEANKQKVDLYKKKYVENHKEHVSEHQKALREYHTKQMWFNRDTFHQKAIQFVKRHWLRPTECPICWSNKNIVIHHPSYDNYDDWSKIIFCCQNCHKGIHSWRRECPKAINLLDMI